MTDRAKKMTNDLNVIGEDIGQLSVEPKSSLISDINVDMLDTRRETAL